MLSEWSYNSSWMFHSRLFMSGKNTELRARRWAFTWILSLVSCANLDKSTFLEETRQKAITLSPFISSLIILNIYYNSQWEAIQAEPLRPALSRVSGVRLCGWHSSTQDFLNLVPSLSFSRCDLVARWSACQSFHFFICKMQIIKGVHIRGLLRVDKECI